MRILFEEYQYQPEHLGNVIKDITGVEQDIVDKKIRLGYVGYFFSPAVNDCVFILPKVLLDANDKVANIKSEKDGGEIKPEDIITPEGQKKHLSSEYRKFIYEFAVWIYRAIYMYRKLNDKQESIYSKNLPIEGRGHKHKARTILDIILSLIRFNRENQNFFLFTIKNLHSGHNKINWTRTISHSQALIQNGAPIYLNPVNKKRIINFDEELFVIFFSILNYLNDEYGFNTPLNCQYELITGNRFESYRKGLGKKRLRQIKYKYFSDKALELWNLCYAFFESSHQICVNTDQKDFLLAKKFEHVFESMIDELIGIPTRDIPKGLAEQDDGKRVDHMYTYQSLTSNSENDEVYYIGDSKYYKSGHDLGKESIYKQYTYARNVVQWNINLFMNQDTSGWTDDEKKEYKEDQNRFKSIQLRNDDNITEGYNVIPNFFLSAYVEKDRAYNAGDNIKGHNTGSNKTDENGRIRPMTYVSCQFENRLFDRDTLILSHYDVNFLYVIYLYARNRSSEKSAWCNKVRAIFRTEIQKVLEEKYDFYAMTAKEGVNATSFFEHHFQEILGKVFAPYPDRDHQKYFSVALDKKNEFQEENAALLSHLKSSFYIEKCVNHDGKTQIDIDPMTILPEVNPLAHYSTTSKYLTYHYLENNLENDILIGCYHDQEHLDWILGKNDKGSLIYNIRMGNGARAGEYKLSELNAKNVKFIVLYEQYKESENQYRVFRFHHKAIMDKERMKKSGYPNPKSEKYYCYIFDEEVTLGELDIDKAIKHEREFETEPGIGVPIFIKGKELIEYRKK